MKAVIMAGGEGARLRPLTCDLPKPMVPIMDKPMMEYIVELLAEHGFSDLAVTLQYLPEKIQNHFGNGEKFASNFSYFLEEEPLGTAGSVKNAASFLDETFLVISGDCLTDINLSEAIKFHRKNNSLVTIVLTPQDNPLEYGIVMTNDEGKITRFLEKPRWGEVFSDTVNTGIYILEPEIFEYIPTGKKFDFSKDLFPLLMDKGLSLYGCVLSGYWCDIGSLDQYRYSHYDILDKKISINLPAKEEEPGIWIADEVCIDPEARLIPPFYIGKGTYVGAKAFIGEYATLGSYNHISEKVSLKRGVTWSRVTLEKNVIVRGSVLAGGVRLEAAASVYEGVVVGERSIVESKATLKPGVRIWPYKRVESGALVNSNLIWGNQFRRSLFGADGVRGELNGDLTLENALKMGSAFAFMLGGSVPVVIGGDSWEPSQLLKKAITVGLLAGGAEVLDIGETIVPAVRMGIEGLGAEGGIYVHSCSSNYGYSAIRFFDKEGLNLLHGKERSLEQIYLRDDFPRAIKDKLGSLKVIQDYNKNYNESLLKDLSLQSIKEANLSILMAFPPPHLQNLLLPLLQDLNCNLIVFYPPGRAKLACWKEDDFAVYKNEISRSIVRGEIDLGFWINPSGERMVLFDEEGTEISGEVYQALLSLLILQSGKNSTLVQPITASWIHEELARKNKGSVLRSKTFPRHIQEKIRDLNISAKSLKGGTYVPAEFLQLNAVSSLMKLIDSLALGGKSLSTLLKEIPGINLRQKEIPCPWGQKGRVMRRLIQDGPGEAEKVEMIDGLKFYYPDGWALVLPDPEKPSYRIYGEGFTEEIAESLTDLFAEKVKSLQDESVNEKEKETIK
ncbi:MAG: sugar phosphate nucleotidyltransferase [Bacillota bacterium]|nr:sugar phosphate nucleotidyltransferase [Bacillota bacterium]